jgi:hypothetical protein
MAIRNPQPPQVNGVIYDLLDVSLALSTRPQDARRALSIAVTFRPYRDGESGPEYLEAAQPVSLVYGDAFLAAADDPALAQFLGVLEAAAQQFVNARV